MANTEFKTKKTLRTFFTELKTEILLLVALIWSSTVIWLRFLKTSFCDGRKHTDITTFINEKWSFKQDTCNTYCW